MAQGIDSRAAAAGGATPDSAFTLNKFQLDALQSRFNHTDDDGNGVLSKNELQAVLTENYSEDAKAAAKILLEHFDDARNFASPATKDTMTNDPDSYDFKRLFAQDSSDPSGISRKDMQSMAEVMDSAQVAKLLTDIRWSEKKGAVGIAAISAAEFGFAGVMAYWGATGAGVFIGAQASYFGYRAYNSLFNSDVPKFSDYVNQRRDMLASWKGR